MGYKRITLTTITSMVIVVLSALTAGYLTAFYICLLYTSDAADE